jgi:crossover junction endodeoxyribonuclease RusA
VTLVHLPWPTGPLSQNSRAHWSVRQRHVRNARRAAWALTVEARATAGETPELRFTFHPPNRVRRDVSNVIGALKASVDGIADALGVDDSRFRISWPVEFAAPVKGGAVVVEVA